MKKHASTFRDRAYLAPILTLVYLGLISIPFSRLGVDGPYFAEGMKDLMKALFLLIAGITLYHESYPSLPFISGPFRRVGLCFFPFLFLGTSNLIFLAMAPQADKATSFAAGPFFFALLGVFLGAACEELCFRYLIEGLFLEKMKPGLAVLFSALIFGAAHLLNFFSGAGVGPTFAQAGYTTLLGLALGLSYAYSLNFWFVTLAHFLFNALNDVLFGAIYQGEWTSTFFWVNGVFAAVFCLYGAWIFFLLHRHEKNISSPKEKKQ